MEFPSPRRVSAPRVLFWSGLFVLLAMLVLPATGAYAQGQGKRIMLYTGTTGFRHTDGINGGRPVIQSKLEALGYTVDWEDCTNNTNVPGSGPLAISCNHPEKNPRIFTPTNLARYDAIVMLNMSWGVNSPLLDAAGKDALVGYLQNGGGIAGMHNATDAGAGQAIWNWWDGDPDSVVGTTMPGHSANSTTANAATVQTIDNNNLSTRDLADTWTIADEHYNYNRNVRGTHHVLANYDERTYNPGPNAKGQDHPITWCKLYDGAAVNDGTGVPKPYRDGRTWVTGMGHNGVRYTENNGDNNMVKMMVGGVRWVAGEGRKTDCSGSTWASFRRTVLVPDASQPIGIDIAKDGKVYWSEMGQIGVSPGYLSQGAIMMHDQKGPAGNKTVVGTIQTRADHGSSEDGVLGFTLQPGFDLADPNKRHLFVYYSPRPGPGDNWPLDAANPGQVVGHNQISRFTVSADGTSVVPNSERVILKVPKAKLAGNASGFPGGPTNGGPGHVGGAGLDFDSAGSLYLGVGDDVSPNASGHNGYTPMDYRSAERWDARKTSANSADLRGKVLRIRPTLDLIAPNAEPGAGSTYSIPAGNLFPVGMEKTRPEIYAMGFRQPFTLHTDPANPGIVGVGEYCHDANTDRADRSPAGTCEWNLLNKPGNHGWPFCVGDNSPANTATRWDYAAAVSTGQKYDCSTPTIPSDLTWAPAGQTAAPPTFPGLDTIPKPEKATIFKKYPTAGNLGIENPLDFGNLAEGGMQPVAGPIYRYNGATAGSGAFPAYYDGSWLINNRGSNTGFWKEVRMRQDNNEMLRVQDWLPYNHAGNATTQLNALVIGTQFGDDGALYMARYSVGCCRPNATTVPQVQIVKISFDVYEESAAPTTTAELDPAAPGVGRTYPGPVTVKFTSTDAGGTASQPTAGVDYIEHRVNLNGGTGAWVRSTNAGTANPFTSSLTLSEMGNYVIEYRSADRGGNADATKSIAFTVFRPTEVIGEVKGTVASVLGLTLGAPATFSPFVPGVAAQYTATTTATVTSTWPTASLTVRDPSTTNNGRLVNGTAPLASAVQAMNSSAAFANISATPLTLKTWAAPVSSEASTLTFRQSITATEPLTAGTYAKALTFTLTTTTP